MEFSHYEELPRFKSRDQRRPKRNARRPRSTKERKVLAREMQRDRFRTTQDVRFASHSPRETLTLSRHAALFRRIQTPGFPRCAYLGRRVTMTIESPRAGDLGAPNLGRTDQMMETSKLGNRSSAGSREPTAARPHHPRRAGRQPAPAGQARAPRRIPTGCAKKSRRCAASSARCSRTWRRCRGRYEYLKSEQASVAEALVHEPDGAADQRDGGQAARDPGAEPGGCPALIETDAAGAGPAPGPAASLG